jgi:protein phosphatase
MALGFRYAARSHVGMVRSNNQDSGYAGPRLLAMADGMGGHAGGDIASSVVVGHLVDLDGEAVSGADAGPALQRRLKAANEELADRIRQEPELDGMGTTLIAILRAHNRLTIAHIGDSRAFLARDGKVSQITQDHSYVQQLVDEGRISEDEAKTHPQRSLVTRVLTGRAEDVPDIAVREARIGDRYMIASDGLTDYVGRETIDEQLLAPGRDAGEVADSLVQLALKAGAPDNVTVVIGDFVDGKTTKAMTEPQIVGSAALERRGTKPIPVTPAEKAAALQEETREEQQELEFVTLAEEGPATGRTKWTRRLVGLALTLAVIAAGTYGAYAWSQRQYYVGVKGGYVAIYQGVNQRIGPVSLSHDVATSEIAVADLPDFYAKRVTDTVSRPDEQSASALIDELRVQASACRYAKSQGRDCSTSGMTGTTPTPTATATTTTTTTPTTGGSSTSTPPTGLTTGSTP